MTAQRSLSNQLFRFVGAAVLLGALAIAACGRSPATPEKMTIAPAQAGTASGFVVFRQAADPDRNQQASDNRFVPTVAYAFIDRSSPEYYDVVLLEKPLDNQKLAEASDPADVVNDALRDGANGVLFMTDGEGDISGSFRMHAGSAETQFGGSGIGQVRGLVRKDNRVAGHLHYFYSSFSDHMGLDVAFDAPLVMAPVGKPLPADGGDAGAAYLETIAAMRAGDVDKLIALSPPDRAKMMEEERKKPDFAKNLEFIKAMAPAEVEVTGGTSFGERVVLNTKGKEGKDPFTGTVEMNWEAGDWRMGGTSTHMGATNDAAAKSDAPKEPATDKPSPADKVPVLVDDGIVGKGFMDGETEFAPTDAFITAMPADYGDGRLLMMLAEAKLDPKNAKAMWDDDTPIAKAFADGKPHPSLWLNLQRDENGKINEEKAYFVDLEGNAEDTYVSFNVIESDGKIIGVLTQEGSRDDVAYEGVARFNLPITPAP